jgi:NAD-dependent deacetylase
MKTASITPHQQCAQLIKEAHSIVALTGAGISTAAGIPDFRGPKGLYVSKKYDADKVFNIDYFYQDPNPFFEFARDFLEFESKLEPTLAHKFLARLEREEKLKGIVTQNIDSLHQLAGSKAVLEMHGSFWKSFCVECGRAYSFKELKQFLASAKIPYCECKGLIKPDIVFFGENVKHFSEAARLATEAELFFVIGTSCTVYPAASVPHYANGKIIVLNQQPVELPGDVLMQISEDIDTFFTGVEQCLGS